MALYENNGMRYNIVTPGARSISDYFTGGVGCESSFIIKNFL